MKLIFKFFSHSICGYTVAIYYNSTCEARVAVIYKITTDRCNSLKLYDNYLEVVITQWYCSYNTVLSFDVWLHCDRNIIDSRQSTARPVMICMPQAKGFHVVGELIHSIQPQLLMVIITFNCGFQQWVCV